MMKNAIWCASLCAILGMAIGGCSSSPSPATGDSKPAEAKPSGESLSGTITIDGSSTVYKVSAAVAEAFQESNSGVNVNVSISGTGGGFKKFVVGETDIQNASRPITEEEDAEATKNGISFFELPVGYDGLTIVVNPKNTWCEHLTVDELKVIWSGASTIKSWKDVRAGFPDKPLSLYAPGTASGTFDFFTEVICGKKGDMRKDANTSEDDNAIVKGVQNDEGGIGFFGLAYYEANASSLKAVKVDSGSGPVAATKETVSSLQYSPLSRPEFIYVKKSAYERPEVKAFVDYYLGNSGQSLVEEVGYVKFAPELYTRIAKIPATNKLGSIFKGMTGKSVDSVLGNAGL